MPVVSHSQKRKKWLTMGCRSRPRCAWLRCRKIVTAAMVTWVNARATTTYPHHGSGSRPCETSERKSEFIDGGSQGAGGVGAIGFETTSYFTRFQSVFPRLKYASALWDVIAYLPLEPRRPA